MNYVKQCGQCKEIMPLYEHLCYCGGPVKIVKVKLELAQQADSYNVRAWLKSRNK